MADVVFECNAGVIKLDIVEVFEEYDGPILYSCKSPADQHFLSVWADSSGDFDTWLFLPVSRGRLRAIRTGAISLYDSFRRSEESWLYAINTTTINEVPVGRMIPIDRIPDSMLPDPGEYLNLIDDARPGKVDIPTPDHAAATNRNVIDIAMGRPGEKALVGSSHLGRVLQGFQDIIYCEAAPDRRGGPVPGAVQDKYELAVAGFFAASFGVRFETQPTDLFGHGQSDVEKIVESVAALLESSKNEEDFARYLSENRRMAMTISKYRALLGHLSSSNLAFRFLWSRPSRETKSVELSVSEIRQAIDVLKSKEEEDPTMLTVHGELDTISKRRNRFAFISDDGVIYTGTLSKDLSDQTFIVSSRATAEIEELVEFNEVTGESTSTYTLMAIKYEE